MSKVEIRSVASTRLSLSADEFEYYEKLKKIFGEDSFRGLFQTDLSGLLTGISPHTEKATPQPILFFMLNVSFNQRMRQVEKYLLKIDSLDEKIKKIEEKILSFQGTVEVSSIHEGGRR